MNIGSEELAELRNEALLAAMACIKYRKTPAKDRITTEMFKLAEKSLLETIKILLNIYYQEKVEIILIYKKVGNINIENNFP